MEFEGIGSTKGPFQVQHFCQTCLCLYVDRIEWEIWICYVKEFVLQTGLGMSRKLRAYRYSGIINKGNYFVGGDAS